MYKLSGEAYIIRLADNAKLGPPDPLSPHIMSPAWAAYEQWLAEGNTPEPADPVAPVVPQSVKALQGMRAIKHAGLVQKFIDWKATLDPITDFEIIAFLEKAENWNYDDPIIDEVLTSFGEIGRKDELFILAATL
jgi:hypothetical protein